MRSLAFIVGLLAAAAPVLATQVIVGGTELQSLYPFRCC